MRWNKSATAFHAATVTTMGSVTTIVEAALASRIPCKNVSQTMSSGLSIAAREAKRQENLRINSTRSSQQKVPNPSKE